MRVIPHGQAAKSLLLTALFVLVPLALSANVAPVIDSLTATPPAVGQGETVLLELAAHDPDCPDTCGPGSGCFLYIDAGQTTWSAAEGTFQNQVNNTNASPYTATVEWVAPAADGSYQVNVSIRDNGGMLCFGDPLTTTDSITITVGATSPPPVIEELTASPAQLFVGETSSLTCFATDPEDDPVTYSWQSDSGSVIPGANGAATFQASEVGIATITCTATDPYGASDSDTVQVSVPEAIADSVLTAGLVEPWRLSVDSDGNVFVIDRGAGGLVVVNLFSGELVYRLPLPGATSIAVDWNDNLLIGGRSGARVVDRLGAPVLDLSTSSNLGRVADVAVDAVN
ncbi:MAG: hypothetical protein EP299_06860, partial [Acidobacteria bacterium]